MRLDRATLNRLGVSCGTYNREARTTLARAQYDHSRAARAMTNQTPIRRELSVVVEQYMRQVQNGDMTMEEAAQFINQLPSEPVEEKQEQVQEAPKPKQAKGKKKKKQRRRKRKINSSLRDQLSKVKL